MVFFCDLDGLRDEKRSPNVGGFFEKILANILTQDYNILEPHLIDARNIGWGTSFNEMQHLIREALVTHNMGTQRWRFLGIISKHIPLVVRFPSNSTLHVLAPCLIRILAS